MAKDPAFLFYSSDFAMGTQFMSDEQVGKYIRLLIAQHLHGRLTEKQVMHICKTYDEDVMLKFKKDTDGKYYNERLEAEISRRKNYSLSRAANKKGKNSTHDNHMLNTSTTYVHHMETENENEIENTNEINKKERRQKFTPPDIGEVMNYAGVLGDFASDEPSKFVDYYTSNGWKVGKNQMKDWRASYRNWIKNAKNFNNVKHSENGRKGHSMDRVVAAADEVLRNIGLQHGNGSHTE